MAKNLKSLTLTYDKESEKKAEETKKMIGKRFVVVLKRMLL